MMRSFKLGTYRIGTSWHNLTVMAAMVAISPLVIAGFDNL